MIPEYWQTRIPPLPRGSGNPGEPPRSVWAMASPPDAPFYLQGGSFQLRTLIHSNTTDI